MLPQVECVAQYHVGEWAHFNTDIFFNVLIHQVGEKEDLETVANTLTVQFDAGVQVGDILVVSLPSVAEGMHAKG